MVAIVREWDEQPESVERLMRRIGKAVRGSLRPVQDPRQTAFQYEEERNER